VQDQQGRKRHHTYKRDQRHEPKTKRYQQTSDEDNRQYDRRAATTQSRPARRPLE
jgi:hypothetical protein